MLIGSWQHQTDVIRDFPAMSGCRPVPGGVGSAMQQSTAEASAREPSRKGDSAAARTASEARWASADAGLTEEEAGMAATPRPRAAVPGQVSKRCRGGDSKRLYRRRSRPCQIRAPVCPHQLLQRWRASHSNVSVTAASSVRAHHAPLEAETMTDPACSTK